MTAPPYADRTVDVDADRDVSHLPRQWPAALSPQVLGAIDMPTPFLAHDLDTVADRCAEFAAALPGVRPYFAMKCNPTPDLLRTLHRLGTGFEIASLGEMQALQALGVDPADLLYSNPVKPPSHVAGTFAAGLWRYSFDSAGELRKLAELAPGSAVYIRLRVDDSASIFPLSRKFGVDPAEAADLMRYARSLGLRPYGATFHVGSQSRDATAFRRAVGAVGAMMNDLVADDIVLEMLDLGGGFPAFYGKDVPTIAEIGEITMAAVDELLPYRPVELVAEPGRYLVAEAAVMVTSVIGREVRDGANWLHIDVGTYNGMMESMEGVRGWTYPLWSSVADHAGAPQASFVVTGPTCDSADTLFYGVMLPASIDVGDVLYIGSAGAYTISYASTFNGFQPPATLTVGGAEATG